MTPPQPGPRPDTPQPRDIALELGTPEQTADLEAQSTAAEPLPGPGPGTAREPSDGS